MDNKYSYMAALNIIELLKGVGLDILDGSIFKKYPAVKGILIFIVLLSLVSPVLLLVGLIASLWVINKIGPSKAGARSIIKPPKQGD